MRRQPYHVVLLARIADQPGAFPQGGYVVGKRRGAALLKLGLVAEEVVEIVDELADDGFELEREHDVAVGAHHVAVAHAVEGVCGEGLLKRRVVIAHGKPGVSDAVYLHGRRQHAGEDDLPLAARGDIGADDGVARSEHLVKHASDVVGVARPRRYRAIVAILIEQVDVGVLPVVGARGVDVELLLDVGTLGKVRHVAVDVGQVVPVALREQRERLCGLLVHMRDAADALLVELAVKIGDVGAHRAGDDNHKADEQGEEPCLGAHERFQADVHVKRLPRPENVPRSIASVPHGPAGQPACRAVQIADCRRAGNPKLART